MSYSTKIQASPAAIEAAKTPPSELLNTSQLADEIDVSPRTVEGWRLTGEGPPYIRCGSRAVRYRRADVIDWLSARRFTSTSAETVG
jgi:hypothetical protein